MSASTPRQDPFPVALREWRERHNLTQQQAADQLGVCNGSMVSHYERGVHTPHPKAIKRMHHAMRRFERDTAQAVAERLSTGDDLRAWMRAHSVSVSDAARLLGVRASEINALRGLKGDDLPAHISGRLEVIGKVSALASKSAATTLNALDAYIETREITGAALSREVGVSDSSMHGWLTGSSRPRWVNQVMVLAHIHDNAPELLGMCAPALDRKETRTPEARPAAAPPPIVTIEAREPVDLDPATMRAAHTLTVSALIDALGPRVAVLLVRRGGQQSWPALAEELGWPRERLVAVASGRHAPPTEDELGELDAAWGAIRCEWTRDVISPWALRVWLKVDAPAALAEVLHHADTRHIARQLGVRPERVSAWVSGSEIMLHGYREELVAAWRSWHTDAAPAEAEQPTLEQEPAPATEPPGPSAPSTRWPIT